MGDQIVVDETELLDMYARMDDSRAKMRMRRLLREAEAVNVGALDQARAEGFGAGMFFTSLMLTVGDTDTGEFNES